MDNYDEKYKFYLSGIIDEQLYQQVLTLALSLLPDKPSTEYMLYPSRSIKYADITVNPYIAYMLTRLSFNVTLITADPDIIRAMYCSKLLLMKHSYILAVEHYHIIKCDNDYLWNEENYAAYGCPMLIVPIKGNYPAFLRGKKLTEEWIMLQGTVTTNCQSTIIPLQVTPVVIQDTNFFAQYNKTVADKLATTCDFTAQQQNLDKWYGLTNIFPHNIIVTSQQLQICHDNMYNSNTALYKTDNGYLLASSLVNYTIDPDFTPLTDITRNPDIINQKIMLVTCDKEFKVLEQQLLQDVINFPANINGVTDPRFIDQNTLLLTSRNENEKQDNQLLIIKLTNNIITERIVLPKRGKDHEKNWLPFYVQNNLYYIYDFNPFTVILPDNSSIKYTFDRLWRGSAAPIPYIHDSTEGYLCMIHEVYFGDNDYRRYYHRWVFFSTDYSMIYYSNPFIFTKQRIQFVLSIIEEEDNIITAYSILDNSFCIASMSKKDITQSLVYQEDNFVV